MGKSVIGEWRYVRFKINCSRPDSVPNVHTIVVNCKTKVSNMTTVVKYFCRFFQSYAIIRNMILQKKLWTKTLTMNFYFIIVFVVQGGDLKMSSYFEVS